jgi:hypothetical protein
MASRFKTTFGKRFEGWLRVRYSEHHKRIVRGRRDARWALFTWPMAGLVLAATPALAVTVTVAILYSQAHPRVAEVLTPESEPVVMPILYALCAGGAVVGLVVGLGAGIAKAAQMIFESERHELLVRQTYFLERLWQQGRRRKRTHAARGAVAANNGALRGQVPVRSDSQAYEPSVHREREVQTPLR